MIPKVRHPPSKPPVLESGDRDTPGGEQHDKPREEQQQTPALLVPVLAVVLGVLGSCGLIAVVAVLLLLVRRSAAARSTQIRDTPCSLPESPDSNPDVIQVYGQ